MSAGYRSIPARRGGARRAGRAEPDPQQRDLGPEADLESVARTICLRLLEGRARTRAELAEALSARHVPDNAARAVLDRFTEVGLIDDAALAVTAAHVQHAERGLSARAVAHKLRRRGIDEATVQAAVGAIDGDSERATAERLVARRMRSLGGQPPEVQRRRLVGVLARKGYSPSLAYDVVRAAIRDPGDEPAWEEPPSD